MKILRTPDERFSSLEEYPFEPHYTNIKTHDGADLRIHHIDEGPKDGDPSQQADDLTSIEEAHDNCILAGVVPVGLYGQGYGGAGNIQSHFMDLAQCPNSVVSTSTRNCPGNTLRSSDAGGQAYEFPSGSGGSNAMALLVEAMVYISTTNSR